MSREIKFRVWDVENKEMLNVQELDFEPTFYGGRIAIRPDQYSDYFDTEDMILMQYTGLHDKNGKEIYEGDIIKCKKYIGGNFVDYCIEKEIPVLPGVVTPSEAIQAVKKGLEVVKFFPAEQYGGVATIKALAAPFTMLKFMPTGGVNVKNLKDYLGCS